MEYRRAAPTCDWGCPEANGYEAPSAESERGVAGKVVQPAAHPPDRRCHGLAEGWVAELLRVVRQLGPLEVKFGCGLRAVVELAKDAPTEQAGFSASPGGCIQ